MSVSHLFWELGQQHKIREADARAGGAERRADEVGTQLDSLVRRVDRLSLACQALWELLRERDGLTDDEVIARMQEIDLRDGRADGKIGSTALECPSCGRRSAASRASCLYCGATLADSRGHVFE